MRPSRGSTATAAPARPRGDAPQLATRRRVGRFGVVAAMNAAVDVGVTTGLVLLLRPDPSPQELAVLSAAGVVAALVHSYAWNSRWTFGDRAAGPSRSDRRAQRLRFALQGGANVAVGALVVWAASRVLDGTTPLPPDAADALAKLLSMVTASTVSYLLMHHLVFRGRGPAAAR
ncbi:GtrA family protein [uncultured Pseudokineococcus sp.]|uniref:GtrA family protein n=1 Tax=uncultured Pseudokineococcus sp. TaxID=1642928 RepID=UPI00262A37AF|nr:GtrA family protein [uncultured Pseudokineococcus sp.]